MFQAKTACLLRAHYCKIMRHDYRPQSSGTRGVTGSQKRCPCTGKTAAAPRSFPLVCFPGAGRPSRPAVPCPRQDYPWRNHPAMVPQLPPGASPPGLHRPHGQMLRFKSPPFHRNPRLAARPVVHVPDHRLLAPGAELSHGFQDSQHDSSRFAA